MMNLGKAPGRVQVELRLGIGLLATALLAISCRGQRPEVSEAQQGKAEARAPVVQQQEPSATSGGPRELDPGDRYAVPMQAPAPAPRMAPKPASSSAPKPAPSSAPALKSGSGLGSAKMRATGQAMGQGFGAGHGRLGASHRMAPIVPMNTESYAHQPENDFVSARDEPLSTFSADVDTASYSNVRRFLHEGTLPPASAVRIEEMLNYFDYEYPLPSRGEPFGVYTEVTEAPWNAAHRVVHIGVKTAKLQQAEVPSRNLVFLLDVSGSMRSPDKLPLLQRSMELLVRNLRAHDKVAIVVYAGASGVVLEPTPGDRKSEILAAIERLRPGGATDGAAGIEKAYSLAHRSFARGSINRVILATDGDFNVGTTSQGELVGLIERERRGGVFLTVLGFGKGNLKDWTMELLADKGNGNYAYIDSLAEARKVLVEESGATLVTVAKDVKFQLEFNPEVVESYRLVGYENRMLAARDFNDDTKDAGEMGAGHSVTALYEIVPVGVRSPAGSTDPLKYQSERSSTNDTSELATLKLRYKTPQGTKSRKLEAVIASDTAALSAADSEHRFATAVAEFGLVLSGSKNAPNADLTRARRRAESALGSPAHPTRRDFLELMERAERLRAKGP